MNEKIELIRKYLLMPKEEIDINSIFKAIKESLAKNKEMIDNYLTFEMGQGFDLGQSQGVFELDSSNKYGNLEHPFINKYGRVSANMAPYGVVGLKVDKKISLTNYLEIIKVCLETRNPLIIKPFKESKTLELIISIINDVIIQTNDFFEIVLTDVEIEKENIDLLIYVGNKQKFENLANKNKIFLGIGQYELYVDEVLDENLVEFAKQNGVQVFYPQDNVYELINMNGGNYCSAIMSGNKEKIREFISRVDSSFLLVNMSPLLVNKANLFPEQLLKRKTTVIYDKMDVKK